MDLKIIDRKELILEAYRIDGITSGECRSIFLDWALSLTDGVQPTDAITKLIEVYGADAPDHPMTAVLKEGLAAQPKARRRGGRAARVAN